MAKTTTTQQAQPKTPVAFLPKPTDPRAELFFLLGRLAGSNVDGAARITELVIDLTQTAAPAETDGE